MGGKRDMGMGELLFCKGGSLKIGSEIIVVGEQRC